MHPATPCLIVDSQVVQNNLKRMQGYADQHGLRLRPHTKTHKSIHVGRLQMELGAKGLTVAKAGEAAVMSNASSDILMAYPPVGPERAEMLAELARRIQLTVALDSEFAVDQLQQAVDRLGVTIGVLVDFDLGYARTGVQSAEASVALAEYVERASGLRLDGMMLYAGHISGSPESQREQMAKVEGQVDELLTAWDAKGLCRDIISSGSTPSAMASHLVPAVNEIRPGTYVYNDMNIVRGGYATLDDCAARIEATVISTAVKDQVVVDAGSKTLTSDLCGPAPDSGHGYLVDYPEARIFRLTEEHAQVDVSQCERRPQIGERVSIIPNHICVCVNMQTSFWWSEPGEEMRLMPVDSRGLLV